MFQRNSRPDTEEIIVTDDPKKAEKFVRNSVYGRFMVERVLESEDYVTDLDQTLRLSQFVIIERVGEKPKGKAVRTIKLLKPEQKMHFRLAPESKDAEFLLVIDQRQFEKLDEDLQERLLFDQISLLFLDTENAKYRQDHALRVNPKVAKRFKKKDPETNAILRAAQEGADV